MGFNSGFKGLKSLRLRIIRLMQVLNKVKMEILKNAEFLFTGMSAIGRKWLRNSYCWAITVTFQAFECGCQLCTLFGPRVYTHRIDHRHALFPKLRKI